jgi:hypothetical protein
MRDFSAAFPQLRGMDHTTVNLRLYPVHQPVENCVNSGSFAA